jgi:hypothetical protein
MAARQHGSDGWSLAGILFFRNGDQPIRTLPDRVVLSRPGGCDASGFVRAMLVRPAS